MSARGESDRLGHDSEAIAGFLPLVDVLLAVLCVAMVAAGRRETMQVPVTLPSDHGATARASGDPTVVAVDKLGRTTIDGAVIPFEELRRHLDRMGPNAAVLLAGDAAAPYESIARLLLVLQEHGGTTVRLLLHQAPHTQ